MHNIFLLFFIGWSLGGGTVISEDKEVRNLRQTAEAASHRGDYLSAKEYYELLLQKSSRYDRATFVDFALRLAKVDLILELYTEGEELLQRVLLGPPPQEFVSQVQLLRARFLCGDKKRDAGYLLMKGVERNTPVENWTAEDRSFYQALTYALNTHYDAILNKAKRFSVAHSHSEAAAMYKKLLEAIVKGIYPKGASAFLKQSVQYRLAEANFQEAKFEKTLAVIESMTRGCADTKIDHEILFLAALAYRQQRDFEKSLNYFHSYLNAADKKDLPHFEQALFEIGMDAFRNENYAKAKRYFEKLPSNGNKTTLLATLYLAKIALKENKPKKAEELLSPLSPQDASKYEITYLRGEAAFLTKEYATAAEFFEKALPPKGQPALWKGQALYQLGWCNIKLGDDKLKSAKAREAFFTKAEKLLKMLHGDKMLEKGSLALGRLYLLWEKEDKLSELLSQRLAAFSLEGQGQALLLLAQGSFDYKTKESYCEKVTDAPYASFPYYAEGWFLRGLNHFCHRKYEKALFSLEKAFALSNTKYASTILKLEAQAQYYLHAPLTSFALLDKAFHNPALSEQEKEEILYLRGLIASHTDDETHLPIAEESLTQLLSQYPGGKHAPDALFVLSTLFFQKEDFFKAKEQFIKLSQSYPLSPLAGEALFWAAEATEQLHDKENATALRHQIVEEFPRSSRAPEAYFKLFAFEDYLEGKNGALEHLHNFVSLFPFSPLLVKAYHLIGSHETHYPTAKDALERAIEAFLCYANTEKEPDITLIHDYYRSSLDLALLHLAEEKCTEAVAILEKMTHEFSKKSHPFTSKITNDNPYPPLFEESQFTLAQAYLRQGRDYEAQEMLSSMLAIYGSAGIDGGYFLSHVWLEQAQMAKSCSDTKTALTCLEMAEESGMGYLSTDQYLNLWILQSDCYRQNGEYDRAMSMLSKVVNEDAISPLRVQAMFLRSEIYALQGRDELALRQLEATAKKGGSWAERAKLKLRTEYGIH